MYQLIIESGQRHGERLQPTQRELRIGRGPANQLRLQDDGVSDRHCAIAVTRRGIMIRDFDSANGVYVDNERVAKELRLRSGSLIDIGSAKLRFEFMHGVPNPRRRMSPFFGISLITLLLILAVELSAVGLAFWMRHHRMTDAEINAVLQRFPNVNLDELPDAVKPTRPPAGPPAQPSKNL